MRRRGTHLLGSLLCACLWCGCVQTRITEPPRTAVEQLLLATATDRALEKSNFAPLASRKVFVDAAYLETYDKQYVVGSIRNVLSESGALLVTNATLAEIIVEPRSGALSTDSSESIVGVPSAPVPVPFAGTFKTPEIYLFKAQKQFSIARISLFAYEAENRKHVLSSGPLVGRSRHNYYSFLGYFKYTSTAIPEKRSRGWFFRKED